MDRKQWEKAVAAALGLVRSRGLQFVAPSDFPAVRRDDGLSVAAGAAAEWYGLPWTLTEWRRRTDGDWVAVAGPVESDPEWLRAGAGEWLLYLLSREGKPAAPLARLSRLRPDLVSLMPEWLWLLETGCFGEPFVSWYLREKGASGVVPESVLSRYVSWVAGKRGSILNKAESLARLSLERPDLVSRVPKSVWLRKDRSGEPLVSLYLRCDGVSGVVPESVLSRYVSLVASERDGELCEWYNAKSLARLSRERPDLVSRVPESVWMLETVCFGEPFVGWYLREGGVSGVVPESVWLRKNDYYYAEPLVSEYLRAGGAATAVPGAQG